MEPREIEKALVFAPRNCTGNSGAVGDTVLQTSFIRTLLDRSLFPAVKELHWWGTRGVISCLFPHFNRLVGVHEWKGDLEGLEEDKAFPKLMSTEHNNGKSFVFICTHDKEVVKKIRCDAGLNVVCYEPVNGLDAQSSIHLTRQLHSTLCHLGIHVSNPAWPRIEVSASNINEARKCMAPEILCGGGSEASQEGLHAFDADVDRIYLLLPGLKHGSWDRRTWNVTKWKELVRILAEVGVVIVGCDADEVGAGKDIIAGEPTYNWRFVKKLTLQEIASWACSATVCIARDSGPMHVAAAAVGPQGYARVLGLFSVMCPDTWSPLSDNFKGLGRWPLPLEPYITPDEVALQATQWKMTESE